MADRVIKAEPKEMTELDYLLDDLYNADDYKDLTKSQIKVLFAKEKENGKSDALKECYKVINEILEIFIEQLDYFDVLDYTKTITRMYIKEIIEKWKIEENQS